MPLAIEEESIEYGEDMQADADYSLAANIIVTTILAVIMLGLFLVAQIFFVENDILRTICWLISAAFGIVCINRITVLVVKCVTGNRTTRCMI